MRPLDPVPILIHRADILSAIKALYLARPAWRDALRAMAVALGVSVEFEQFLKREDGRND